MAALARLRLTPEEVSQLTLQLDAILDYMAQLNQLATDGVDPFRHDPETGSAMREDLVTNRADPETLLANAPDRHGTFFKVPKILE